MAALYEKAGIAATIRRYRSDEADIDAVLYGHPFTTEVKRDQRHALTGNLAIEFYNTRSGQSSGLDSSASDLWVVVLEPKGQMTAWVCRTELLRQFVARVAPLRTVMAAGDGNAAIKLYAADVLLPAVFHRLDDLQPGELRQQLVELLGEPFRSLARVVDGDGNHGT